MVRVHFEHRRGIKDESNNILRDPSQRMRQKVLKLGQDSGSLLNAEEIFTKVGVINEVHHLFIGVCADDSSHDGARRGARYDSRKQPCKEEEGSQATR